jgi:hypothetical protein
MRKLTPPILLILFAFIFAFGAKAQSKITTQWSYAGISYPSQQAAVQEMQAGAPQNSGSLRKTRGG